MSASNQVAGFTPGGNGLHFVNSWPSEPDIVVNVPALGNVAIGNASNGLCGGMVFAVRDFFEAHLPVVPDTTPPAAESPLFNYIVGRLFDSFNIPAGVLKYYSWMNTPDHDTGVWLATRHGVAWMTIKVYDPNTSPVSADQVQMSLNISNPSQTTPISHNIAIGLPVRGFFHVDYEPHDPSALEPPQLPSSSLPFLRVTVTPFPDRTDRFVSLIVHATE
jgi:hypothetical protein